MHTIDQRAQCGISFDLPRLRFAAKAIAHFIVVAGQFGLRGRHAFTHTRQIMIHGRIYITSQNAHFQKRK